MPERLFLDLRGFAGMQPINRGSAPTGTVAVSNQAETQDLSFSAHPYLRQHFSDLGFAELGGTLSRTTQSGLSANQLAGLSAAQLANLAASTASGKGQNLTSKQEYFSLTSGPAFGRISAGLLLSATQEAGSGAAGNSHSDQGTASFGYAITRDITALATVGYDDVHYSGTQPYNYTGLDWSGGGRWVPNPDSSITVTYGSLEGVEFRPGRCQLCPDRPHPRVRPLFQGDRHRPGTTARRGERLHPGPDGQPAGHQRRPAATRQQLLRRAE